MNEEWQTVMVAAVIMLLVGINIGCRLEARIWRGKAISGFRMASGGKLYTVHDEADTRGNEPDGGR